MSENKYNFIPALVSTRYVEYKLVPKWGQMLYKLIHVVHSVLYSINYCDYILSKRALNHFFLEKKQHSNPLFPSRQRTSRKACISNSRRFINCHNRTPSYSHPNNSIQRTKPNKRIKLHTPLEPFGGCNHLRALERRHSLGDSAYSIWELYIRFGVQCISHHTHCLGFRVGHSQHCWLIETRHFMLCNLSWE